MNKTNPIMKEIRNWHVVYTKSNCERKVAQRIASKGVESYLPQYTIIKRSRQPAEIALRLLFPRWVFLYCTPAQLLELKKVDGIINALYWQSSPAIVPEQEISQIRYALSYFREVELQKNVPRANCSSGPIQDGKVTFPLTSLGYVLLAKGEIEGVEARRTTFAIAEALKMPKPSKPQESVQAMLRKLPSMFRRGVVKLPVYLAGMLG